MSSRPFQLRTLVIGDEPASWMAAGFALDGTVTRVGETTIELVGPDHGRGILQAGVDGITEEVDGMPLGADLGGPHAVDQEPHPNRVVGFDHLVALSPDIERTTAALEGVGLEERGVRRFEAGGSTRRQSFFWLGSVILEVTGDDTARGEGPTHLWGLAFTCDDLQVTAEHLGPALGSVKPAVQTGREIATVRTGDLGISLPIALMSPHRSSE